MKLIKQLSFLLIIFIFFTQVLLTNLANANGVTRYEVIAPDDTVTNISPITDTEFGIRSDSQTGLIINNSSSISITGVGTTNPYGIGILSSATA